MVNTHRIWIAGLALVVSGGLAMAQNSAPTAQQNPGPPPAGPGQQMHPMHRPMMHGQDKGECPKCQMPMKTEKVTFLGVAVESADRAMQAQLGLPHGVGLTVEQVIDNSPAKAAGLQRFDVLEKIDDQLLVNTRQLRTLIHNHRPGDKVNLTLIRNGKVVQSSVTLAEHEVSHCSMMIGPHGEHHFHPGIQGIQGMPPEMHEMMRHMQMHCPPEGGPMGMGNPQQGPMSGQVMGMNRQGPPSQSMATATYSDTQHTVTLTQTNGHKTLIARDANGNVLFNGPIDTPAQQQQIPPQIRPQVQQLQQQLHTGIPAPFEAPAPGMRGPGPMPQGGPPPA